jgi:hypothetical protein
MGNDSVALDWSKATPVDTPAAAAAPTLDWSKATPAPPGSDADALDTSTGLPFTDRVHLASADSLEEKRAYLESVYGKANVSAVRQMNGTESLTVKHGNQWVLAEGGSAAENFGASLASHVPSLSGMAAGATAGAEIGAFGGPLDPITIPTGAAVGGAIGGMAGKTVEKGVQAATAPATIRPMFAKGGETFAKSIADAGEGGALGEAGGQVAGKVIGKIARGGLPERFTGSTAEIKKQFVRIKAMGGRPPIMSATPDLRYLSRMEILAGKVTGPASSRNTINREVLAGQAKRVLVNGGVPKHEVDAVYEDLKNGHFVQSGEPVGEAVAKRVQAHQALLQKRVDDAITLAKSETDKQIKTFDDLAARYEKGTLGVDVAKGFQSAKAQFQVTMRHVYKQVDKLFGDKPIIETDGIRGVANMLLKKAQGVKPSGAAGQAARVGAPAAQGAADINASATPQLDAAALFKEFGIDLPAEGAAEGKITWEQAQRMRSVLRDAADGPSIIKNIKQREIGLIADAVDRAMMKAGMSTEAKGAGPLLKAADSAYGEGRSKFADAQLRTFLNDLRSTRVAPDPHKVAELLIQSGKTERALEFKKTLGPEVWNKVVAQDMDNVLFRAKDPITGAVDPTRLAAVIAGRRGMMGTIHGADVEARMIALTRNLAAVNGKIPAEALEPGAFRGFMEQHEAAVKDLNQFVDKDPIAALADPKIPPEQVYARVTKPENSSLLRHVVDFLAPVGKNGIRPQSQELNALRETALRQAIAESETVSTFNKESEVGDNLTAYLAEYPKASQDLLFPGGMTDALHQFDTDVQFLFPIIKDPAVSGFKAGEELGYWFAKRWYTQAKIALGRMIINHPGFETYLIGERAPGKLVTGRWSEGLPKGQVNPLYGVGLKSASMQMSRYFMEEAMSEDADRPEQPSGP